MLNWEKKKDEISRLNEEVNKLKNEKLELALLKEQIMELRESMELAMEEGKPSRVRPGGVPGRVD